MRCKSNRRTGSALDASSRTGKRMKQCRFLKKWVSLEEKLWQQPPKSEQISNKLQYKRTKRHVSQTFDKFLTNSEIINNHNSIIHSFQKSLDTYLLCRLDMYYHTTKVCKSCIELFVINVNTGQMKKLPTLKVQLVSTTEIAISNQTICTWMTSQLTSFHVRTEFCCHTPSPIITYSWPMIVSVTIQKLHTIAPSSNFEVQS